MTLDAADRPLRLAAGVLNQTPLDFEGNAARVRRAIDDARRLGAAWLCLPELCLTGYGCEDAFHAPWVWEEATRVLLEEVAPASAGVLVAVGLPVFHHGALYNAAAVCCDGEVVGLVAKQNLAGDGLHYEPRWFKAWPGGRAAEHGLRGGDGATVRVPMGDLVFVVDGVRLGFEICEDAWVADRPGGRLAGRGVDVIFNPSASHFAFGKADVREGFVRNGARAFGAAYVYANLLGNEAGRAIYDGHAHIATPGALVARGPRLIFSDVHVTGAEVDVQTLRAHRARRVGHRPDVEGGPNEVACSIADPPEPAAGVPPLATAQAPWVKKGDTHVKEDDFCRAVALGLFDYARKSHSRGFVVSLSGGADSAAVVALVAKAVELAGNELGLPAVASAWGLDLPENATREEVVAASLTTIYQATRNSGNATKHAAESLAAGIGATHHHADVEPLVAGYTERAEACFGRKLAWETDDVALQNIQARVRSPLAWMLANVEGKLLLSTSNRSEAAVGYATMDGDTSGGLCPVAGIDKAFLRHWLGWLETHGLHGGSPLPELAAVNALQPTAELRPAEQAQTDEGDLMPYPLLDVFEEAAIGRKLSPARTLAEGVKRFPQIPDDRLRVYHARFFRLFARNQWKRERYAPAFHVDDRNLDPKTWCRWPILSGGFERQLARIAENGSR
ncbi:NAD(+) synthase [Phycisphaera mikurensis]|uniref:Glutamine-dependent NAD(+) synthetase n=1 Tax=Phycisphaera mikurensis (strain NBRC 102666 / KCTC 22515 / FYK2301M01) TaxID=1142394 RepID=I0IDM2_PHYMF|nr:NAD(+) synthase [Phycisphaera mikurensis]MBB6441179.1 NAD+ synthase (glutamine-hydrolyzing) [Phycisphaera mikurensis]BAM03360.1 putative glutamine-dependent NAD(+) synthetase [Phycisphaera mikurensis NBRC 102666]